MTNTYMHGLLLETEFRILELLPGEPDDEIRGELRNEPMEIGKGNEVSVRYEALSCTWGAPRPKKQIMCSGKAF